MEDETPEQRSEDLSESEIADEDTLPPEEDADEVAEDEEAEEKKV